MFVRDQETNEPVCRVKVTVDGVFRGETCKVDPLLTPCGKSCFFVELRLGRHVVRLQKQGYVSLTDSLDIKPQMSGKNYFMKRASEPGTEP